MESINVQGYIFPTKLLVQKMSNTKKITILVTITIKLHISKLYKKHNPYSKPCFCNLSTYSNSL